jgi:hypothetical protein
VSVDALPAELKREKKAQLKQAALDRGEIVEEDLVLAIAKKAKVLTSADFLARADSLYPAGIRAALPPPAAAPPVPAVAAAALINPDAAPWGGEAAAAAAAPVPVAPLPTGASVYMPMTLPSPTHAGGDAEHPLSN